MANRKQESILKFSSPHFVKSLTEELLTHGRVKVTGLGIFSLKKNAVGFNPGTKTKEKIEYIKISFAPSVPLKDKVKNWKNK